MLGSLAVSGGRRVLASTILAGKAPNTHENILIARAVAENVVLLLLLFLLLAFSNDFKNV